MQNTSDSAKAHVSGFVAPGFEEVRAEFERNFEERGEIGAAVAAYWRGEKVVDLWGGRRAPVGDAPWNEDTLIVFMSSTKGLAAMTLALANSRGWLDYDAPVARYWPEFAQNGKAGVTVRQLLGHEAGLVLLDEELRIEQMHDLDSVASLLARQKPAWPPGTRHGYHTMSLGLYMQELIRHADPAHRTLGRFFHEEIAVPLGIEFYIGLPSAIPDERLATVKTLSIVRGLLALPRTPPCNAEEVLPTAVDDPQVVPLLGSVLERSAHARSGVAGRQRRRARLARSRAPIPLSPRAAPSLASRRRRSPASPHCPRPIIPRTKCSASQRTSPSASCDPGPTVWFGSSPRAFCAPGAGGSFAFADPDARLGYAYVMNKLDFYYNDDPREKPLRDAVYRAIRRRGPSPSRSVRARTPERELVHEGGRTGGVR